MNVFTGAGVVEPGAVVEAAGFAPNRFDPADVLEPPNRPPPEGAVVEVPLPSCFGACPKLNGEDVAVVAVAVVVGVPNKLLPPPPGALEAGFAPKLGVFAAVPPNNPVPEPVPVFALPNNDPDCGALEPIPAPKGPAAGVDPPPKMFVEGFVVAGVPPKLKGALLVLLPNKPPAPLFWFVLDDPEPELPPVDPKLNAIASV